MKKFILIFLICICLGGVGYLGYVVFNSKSIESVEISGEMQTLYIVGDDLNFQDAQLKVTYKNGNIKMVDLSSKTVDVSLFSTSLQTHGTMKIAYKSFVLDVEYDVVYKGMYYVSKETTSTASSTSSSSGVSYTSNSTPMMFYLDNNGVLDYYYKENGKTYMHDGSYDKSYKYIIDGDTIQVYLGNDEIAYEIQANYNSSGTMTLKSVTLNTMDYDPDIVASKEEKIYTFNSSFKTDRRISSVEVDLSQTSYITQGSYKFVTFKVGETIKSSEKVLLLKVNIANDSYLSTVYVYITDSMVTRNSLDTSLVTDLGHMLCAYEGQDFDINYKVVNG